MALLSQAVSLIYPPLCPACRIPVDTALPTPLCPDCLKTCETIEGPICPKCGRPFDNKAAPDHQCETCTRQPPGFDTCRSIFSYNGAIRRMILRIKFRGDMYAARYLSLLSAQQIDKIVAQEQMPCKIVPIPLHWRKLLHRGFNQSELMAKYIFPAGLMADNILCRTKNTRSQRGLTKKERDKNVKNVFQAKGAVRKGCFIILDDVYTTGATVNSAAHALRKAGADRVHVITIARTPSGKSLNPASHG